MEPTPGRVWRQARVEGYVFTLPSGNIVRIRPVSLDQMIVTGKIPDLLTPVAARSLWAETGVDEIADKEQLAVGYLKLINEIIPFALMEPRIVDEPQEDDEITLEDIEFQDKIAIFNLAIQPTEVLRSFRERQATGVAVVSNGQDNEQPSE